MLLFSFAYRFSLAFVSEDAFERLVMNSWRAHFVNVGTLGSKRHEWRLGCCADDSLTI